VTLAIGSMHFPATPAQVQTLADTERELADVAVQVAELTARVQPVLDAISR
jgi:hypothetical protein